MTAAAQYVADGAPRSRSLGWDLEAVSNWDALSPGAQRAFMERWLKAEKRLPRELRGRDENHPQKSAALNPWTAKIVVAAWWDRAARGGKGFGRCLYEGERGTPDIIDGSWVYEAQDEKGICERSWQILDQHPGVRLTGFNSRGYDGTLLMIRSFVHGVRATRNLVPYRYSTREVLDLYDVLGFWGSSRSTPGLEAVAEILGIPSPKKNLSGAQVDEFYRAGKILDVSRYCVADVMAQAAVEVRWEETLDGVFGERSKGR